MVYGEFAHKSCLKDEIEGSIASLMVKEIIRSIALASLLGIVSLRNGTAIASSNLDEAPGLIAFHSNRSGSDQIYIMYPDGSGLSRLTDPPRINEYPSWSPDAKF